MFSTRGCCVRLTNVCITIWAACSTIAAILAAARTSFAEAVRLNPQYATALNNLGTALQALGESAAAAESFRRAIQLQPNYPEAHFNLGTHLQTEGEFEPAIARFREAIRLRPNYARAHFHLGQVLVSLRRDYDALACYKEAVRLQPDNAEMQLRLGDHLVLKKDWSEAIEALETRLRTSAQSSGANGPLGPCTPIGVRLANVCCRFRSAMVRRRTTIESGRDYLSRAIPSLDAALVLAAPAGYCATTATQRPGINAGTCSIFHTREITGRLRIGYLSGDFYDHPIAHLLQGLFERHDRARFEVFAYSFGVPDDSVYRKRIIAGCDHFSEVAILSIPDLARRIAADGIHILVDLMGHTGVNRLGALALRPAPIQVSFLGMLGTMGADFIDYLIGDQFVTPPEFATGFTEKFAIMPHSYFIAEPEPALPEANVRRADHGLPETGFVYCSFNNTYKFEPRMFEVWMNILRQVPNSVLWLFSSGSIAEENLRREAKARDIDPQRLVFALFRPRPEHLLRHRAADLFLDSLVYNAAATSSLALQVGLPVLTCLGDTFASRVGASLLNAAGLPELVAANLEEYEHGPSNSRGSPMKWHNCVRNSWRSGRVHLYSTRRASSAIWNVPIRRCGTIILRVGRHNRSTWLKCNRPAITDFPTQISTAGSFQNPLKRDGKSRLQFDPLAGDRMIERQPPGVQSQAFGGDDVGPVIRIPNDGTTQPGHMDSYLVLTARLQFHFDQRYLAGNLHHSVMANGAFGIGPIRLATAHSQGASFDQITFDHAFGRRRRSLHHRQVGFHHSRPIRLQRVEDSLRAGKHQQPGGVAVEPMDDKCPAARRACKSAFRWTKAVSVFSSSVETVSNPGGLSMTMRASSSKTMTTPDCFRPCALTAARSRAIAIRSVGRIGWSY